jgi:ACS family tartrate transporter-like MFS transporter
MSASGRASIAEPAAGDNPAVIRKVAWRLMWFLMALYFIAIMDRGNISFAALTMNRDIGLSAEAFGNGVGIMFFTYALFEIPSNLFLAKFGARVTLTRIAILWGLATMLMALSQGPMSFYGLRALLGAAESGLFPGVMLYLSLWFPFAYRARYNAMFNYAVPLSYVFASIISGAILELDGVWGLAGWKWLFLLEGLPAILLGIIGIFYMTNVPREAGWLSPQERDWLQGAIDRDGRAFAAVHEKNILKSLVNPTVLMLGLCNFGLFCGLASLPYWLPQIVRTFGLSYEKIGLVTAVPPLAGLVGMILLSRRSDLKCERFGHAIATMLIAAAGFALVAATHEPTLIIVGFMIANIGVYATQAIFWTIPQSYLAKEIAPGAIAVVTTMGSIGGALIPKVIGHLKDATGSFTAGFLVVAGIFVLASIIIAIVGGRLRTAGPPARPAEAVGAE